MSLFKSEFDKVFESIIGDTGIKEAVYMDNTSAYHTVLEVLEIIHTSPSIDNGPWDVSMHEAHGGYFIVFKTHNPGVPIASNIDNVIALTKAAVSQINDSEPNSLNPAKVKVAIGKNGSELMDETKALIDVLGYTG
jgi:hypothetical protein